MTHVLLIFAGWTLRPGGDTRRRVRVALEHLRSQDRHRGEWYVICLGGRFNAETAATAASVRMRAWIIAERLVPADHILVDLYSRDTFENLACAMSLLKQQGIGAKERELLVVSHPWHANRIQSILKRVYHASARVIPTWHYLTVKQRLAEIFLAGYVLLDPRGEGWLMRWHRARRSAGTTKRR